MQQDAMPIHVTSAVPKTNARPDHYRIAVDGPRASGRAWLCSTKQGLRSKMAPSMMLCGEGKWAKGLGLFLYSHVLEAVLHVRDARMEYFAFSWLP
jgi:hypothetical protein